jgi:hypothetical protein
MRFPETIFEIEFLLFKCSKIAIKKFSQSFLAIFGVFTTLSEFFGVGVGVGVRKIFCSESESESKNFFGSESKKVFFFGVGVGFGVDFFDRAVH